MGLKRKYECFIVLAPCENLGVIVGVGSAALSVKIIDEQKFVSAVVFANGVDGYAAGSAADAAVVGSGLEGSHTAARRTCCGRCH